MFEKERDRKVRTGYYFPKVVIKECSVMMEKNLSDQPVKSSMRTYDDLQKTVTGQGDDYTTGCLQSYNYFKNCFWNCYFNNCFKLKQ